MRALPLALSASLLVAISTISAQQSVDPPRRAFLFKDARGELATARARGDSGVTLVVAAMPGANAKAALLAKRLGGTVRYRDDDVDYLRVHLPLDSVDRLVGDANIHSVDVSISGISRAFGRANDQVPASAWSPAEPSAATSIGSVLPFAPWTVPHGTFGVVRDTTKGRWPPPLPETPLTDRYDPLTDMGAIDWRRANPTFDGRGVGIAIIDQNLDALLPELQVARTLDGTPTRKIAGYMTAVDIDDENDGQWLRMKDSVSAGTDGRFSYNGVAYTAPAAGPYRIAILDEAVFDSLNRAGIDKDLNRDGNPKGSSRLFGVLWNEASNDVWLDTDQDHDFRDEKPYTDYAVRPDFGVLGIDNPATPVRESVSYAVQTDRARKLVSLNFGVASHASLVVGAAAASRGTAGRFDGVAPGARLVNVAEGGAAYGQTEAVIIAMKHPAVDVVFLEQSSVIARNYLLFDGRLVPTVIYGRLIARYKKPLVIPTHNYAVLAAIDDYALAPGAISIGAHESKANFMANHGVRVAMDDNLLITGGYGPMGNGAQKPDIIAPSNYVSTGRGFLEGTAIPGLMQLPPGYNIAGGTSTATPTTAGAVALLISAARQSGVSFDAYRLRQAIMNSGRWIAHLPSYKQGNGVVNVAGAWEALKALDTARTALTIVSRAPVQHATSHLLAEPNVGVGIFEREGWTTGDTGTRVITFTRTTGPRGPLTFAIGWKGNELGAYSSAASVTLPLRTPVDVPVRIAPTAPGVHSAMLTLDYAGSPGIEYRTQATVVAAQLLASDSGYRSQQKVEIPRPGMSHLYYRIPSGVSALRVDVSSTKRKPAVAIMRPDTRTASMVTTGATGGSGAGFGFGAPASNNATYWVSEPVAGTWEVRLQDVDDTRTFDWQQAKIDSAVPPTAVTVTVTALGATAAGALAAGGAFDVTLTNTFGVLPDGNAIGMPMGAARRSTGTLAPRAQQLFDIEVPPGTTMLSTRVRPAAGSSGDLDLYLYDCTKKECVAARADGDPSGGGEMIRIESPAAGRWKAVVDHSGFPASSIAFDYQDVLFNPAFGYVAVTDQPSERAVGVRWASKGNAWVANIPAGRTAMAAVGLRVQPKGSEPFLFGVREVGVGSDRTTDAPGQSRPPQR
ncbi:MAG: S8 family serine peptidase [Gemmatimonadaceae bacterium]|nr:S8 family serine peptidase [Gemmatimonadaceae bacterium]